MTIEEQDRPTRDDLKKFSLRDCRMTKLCHRSRSAEHASRASGLESPETTGSEAQSAEVAGRGSVPPRSAAVSCRRFASR